MSRKKQNTHFVCENCGAEVLPLSNGSYRNHCPVCLYSKHVDHVPGDRKNKCQGLMKPVSLDYNGKKGYQIIHECLKCHEMKKNKVAVDCEQKDQFIPFMVLCNKIM